MYLCYDIKGIQQFIFSVPRLKCIIGGSGLIVAFDAAAEKLESKQEFAGKFHCIFAAGGRGTFFCLDPNIHIGLTTTLVNMAWESGLDLRIGTDPTLPQAIHRADQFYPFTPPLLDTNEAAEPCSMSGLWPVRAGQGRGRNNDVHPLIWKRVEMSRSDELGKFVLRELLTDNLLPTALNDFVPQFFKNVSPDPEDTEDEVEAARIAQMALGERNRWAVVAMDGNDMGRQFLAFQDLHTSAEVAHEWYETMSCALESCTQTAFLYALGKAIERWVQEVSAQAGGIKRYCLSGTNTLILPFRPLILGGDDVTMLCHPSYAMTFVQEMAQVFQAESKTVDLNPRWPGTGGALTMSAGILYTKVTFPLHMAIPYAESLLANAKRQFRTSAHSPGPQKPTPAAVDWDTITDTLIDTPEARRQRELCFEDTELAMHIQLTRRPYVMEPYENAPSLTELLTLKSNLEKANIATSVLARILPNLRRPWSERTVFVASIAKRHRLLMQQLWEGDPQPGQGWTPSSDGKTRMTGLPDALLLMAEEHRMTQSTTES